MVFIGEFLISEKKPDLESIFLVALELKSSEARGIYLDKTCGSNDQLRRQLEELLSANAHMGKFLDETGEDSPPSPIPEAVGTKIGRYKLLQIIGEGGMGVVYMAQQDEPVQRRVALKVIKLGMDTKEVIARFEAERQALAMMDHPNIARALDAGATETGRPYFVMELVQGIPITEYCDRAKLTTKKRLTLFIDVCRAVQSAHQKGIIHRDIKPSNVLVTLHHGEPMPKVIDFGVAKAINQRLTEKTYFTRFATMIGTPAYMSPEQAEMSSMDVDTRADVYSLGVLLYRMLTGTTPFSEERLRSAGFGEMQRIITEEEPERPSTRMSTTSGSGKNESKTQARDFDASLARDLKGELDWITLKCLEKDRGRRYDTPNELAADVRRFLDEEPVLAVAPTLAYQLKKLYQRHRTVARLSVLLLLALVIGLGVSSWQWSEAESARQLAEEKTRDATVSFEKAEVARQLAVEARELADTKTIEARQSEQNLIGALYRNNIVRARLEIDKGNAAGAKTTLENCPEKLRHWEWRLLKQMVDASMFTLKGHTSWVFDVACSPDGRWIASAGGGDPFFGSTPGRKSGPGEIIIWDAESGRQIHTLHGHQHVIEGVAFSPDSKTLASASYDKTVRLWNVETGDELNQDDPFSDNDGFRCVAFSPDGKLIAAGGYGGACWVWNRQSGVRRKVLHHEFGVRAIRFSADSKTLYSLSSAGDVSMGLLAWDLENEKEVVFEGNSLYGNSIALLPEANIVAAPKGRQIKFWNTDTRKLERRDLIAHNGFVEDVEFNPDGLGQFATCSIDSVIRVWKSATAPSADPDFFALLGHEGRVLALDYTSDGNRLVSGGSDGTVRVWDLTRNLEYSNVAVPRVKYSSFHESIGFGAESGDVTLVNQSGQFVAMDVEGHTPKYDGNLIGASALKAKANMGIVCPGETIHVESTGQFALGVTRAKENLIPLKVVRRWDLPSGNNQLDFVGHTVNVENVTSNPGATRIATGSAVRGAPGQIGEFKVWDGQTGNILFEHAEDGLGITRLALSPEGDLLAVACTQTTPGASKGKLKTVSCIRVYEIPSGRELNVYDAIQEFWVAMSFDPQGRRLAAASQQRTVLLWDWSNDVQTTTNHGVAHAADLAFNPDGQRLAIASKFFTKVLDTESGEELLTLRTFGQNTANKNTCNPRVRWSHDGRSLAVSARSLSVWTIPDPKQAPPSPAALSLSVKKRATSVRIQSAHYMAMARKTYWDRARNRLRHVFDAPLNSPVEYRMRATVFEKLSQPEKAAADIAEAERLEKQGVEE